MYLTNKKLIVHECEQERFTQKIHSKTQDSLKHKTALKVTRMTLDRARQVNSCTSLLLL